MGENSLAWFLQDFVHFVRPSLKHRWDRTKYHGWSLFTKIVKYLSPSTIFATNFIVDAQGHFNTQKKPPEVPCKKGVLIKISQSSQENNCVRVSFLIKLQAWGVVLGIEAWGQALAQVFSVNFCEISKTRFLQNTTGRLFLSTEV